MPPNRVTKKRKSAASNASSSSSRSQANIQLVFQRVAIKSDTQRTPEQSPRKPKIPVLSHAQKQAMVDNLQLEITERARKLRAQYALQAQSVRTRLEIRIHRIPAALRKATIGELLDKYEQQEQQQQHGEQKAPEKKNGTAPQIEGPLPESEEASSSTVTRDSASKAMPPPPSRMAEQFKGVFIPPPSENTRTTRNAKRASDESDDKENADAAGLNQPPAKRTRTGASTAAAPAQPQPIRPSTASNANTNSSNQRREPANIPPRVILSPKSANSRAYPHQYQNSPFKPPPQSPQKSQIARTTSPLKPSSVPAVAAVPTAASLAKTADKNNAGGAKGGRPGGGLTRVASNNKQPAGGSTRAKRPPLTNTNKSDDEPIAGRTRGSSASDATGTSNGTVIVRRNAGANTSRTAGATGTYKSATVSVATKKTTTATNNIGRGAAGKQPANATRSTAASTASSIKGKVKSAAASATGSVRGRAGNAGATGAGSVRGTAATTAKKATAAGAKSATVTAASTRAGRSLRSRG
ncbi:MAG: hypothetical protein M1831_007288 [Alyxoria varia]|nr:MAG: hypothetical protein M1831_007288 [Alyxoria varia]